ncbi:MAG: Fic family protein [Bacillota bacterium]
MDEYNPPITITQEILSLVSSICEIVGGINFSQREKSNPRLRRDNRVRTIHSSLAIENNTLSIEQVTAIIGGKKVLGTQREITEVINAHNVYEKISLFDPHSEKDLLKAHEIMMSGLTEECGMFRSGGVGVFNGERLLHMAPPAVFVPTQITDLFSWVKNSNLHPLVKSCVFHYEFEFIHPFADGNGRMGRLWQTLLLSEYQDLFLYLPIESVIKNKQEEYYKVLSISDGIGDSKYFVEFLLDAILETLQEFEEAKTYEMPVQKVIDAIGNDILTAKEIMQRLGLSHLQTFRKNYLNKAINQGVVCMTHPDVPKSRNQKYYIK